MSGAMRARAQLLDGSEHAHPPIADLNGGFMCVPSRVMWIGAPWRGRQRPLCAGLSTVGERVGDRTLPDYGAVLKSTRM